MRRATCPPAARRGAAPSGLRALLWPATLAVAMAAAPASAQSRLQIHAAVTADAPGDTTAMRRQSVATAPDGHVWVGEAVLDLPPSSVQTVGLELDAGGGAALSLWLSDRAGRAFADLTAASVGRALAVVWDGRVLTAPVVESPIRNGLVLVTGLDADEAGRLADALREATAPEPDAPLPTGPRPSAAPRPAPAPPGAPERPPLRLDPPPGLEPAASTAPVGWSARPAAPAPTAPAASWTEPESPPPAESASGVAQAVAQAVARRDWRAVAAMLHPDALPVLRADAVDLLRLDGATVHVEDGATHGSFAAADVLGRTPSSRALSDLDDREVAALSLAGLDVLGAWAPPDPSRTVVAEVPDGRRVHVLLRGAAETAGESEVTVITLAPDADGAWRPLLSQPQGL